MEKLKEFEVYYVDYKCSNCFHSCQMALKKGVEALEPLECPNCECDTCYKVKK